LRGVERENCTTDNPAKNHKTTHNPIL